MVSLTPECPNNDFSIWIFGSNINKNKKRQNVIFAFQIQEYFFPTPFGIYTPNVQIKWKLVALIFFSFVDIFNNNITIN